MPFGLFKLEISFTLLRRSSWCYVIVNVYLMGLAYDELSYETIKEMSIDIFWFLVLNGVVIFPCFCHSKPLRNIREHLQLDWILFNFAWSWFCIVSWRKFTLFALLIMVTRKKNLMGRNPMTWPSKNFLCCNSIDFLCFLLIWMNAFKICSEYICFYTLYEILWEPMMHVT